MAAPEDESLRLVFADWLEEQGLSARAEFIRLRSELTKLSETDARREPLDARLNSLREENKDSLMEQCGVLLGWDGMVTVLRRRLSETIAWCETAQASLRTTALCPHDALLILGQPTIQDPGPWVWQRPTTTWRQSIVDELARDRARLLAKRGQPFSPQHGQGRLLLFDPDGTLSDGAAEAESEGFFDVDNMPAWDTWLCFAEDSSIEAGGYHPFCGWLLCWVPDHLTNLVSNGTRVNPEECIVWANDVDTVLTRKLRAAGLLE